MLASAALVLGFVAALFAGAATLPGAVRDGQPLADGTRRPYRLTGATLFAATHVVLLVATVGLGLSLAPLAERFWQLFAAANALALAASVALFAQGRRRVPRAGFRDYLMGVELDPAWLGVDLKMFAYQPSLIGLWLLALSFAWAQYERHGVVTGRMLLYQAFWWVYLVTHYRREAFMLQTWDVIAERFGLALVWGDLVLVPFFYSIGGWALVDDLRPLAPATAAALVGLFAFALWLFRGSNDQKHRFKADPATRIWGRPAETLGGRLLVSGWWGLGRHLNYTGEVLVYLAIALTAGTRSVLPYLLPLWLAALLAHRALRDERRCRAKYGPLWEAYCARVRFRMVPGVY
jgi:delta14-sterol reductase